MLVRPLGLGSVVTVPDGLRPYGSPGPHSDYQLTTDQGLVVVRQAGPPQQEVEPT